MDTPTPEARCAHPGISIEDVTDLADAVLLVIDADRRIVEVLGPAERLLGVPGTDLIGREPTSYLHPADIDWRDDVRAELARTGRASGRARIRRRGLDYSWVETRLRARADGSILLLLQPADSLLDPQLALRIDPYVLLEPVRDESGITIDFRCSAANEGAAAAFGAMPEHLVGATVGAVMPPREAADVIGWCFEALAGGDVMRDDERWPAADGGEDRYVDVRAIGSPESVTLTWRDVTERHAAVVALQRSESELRGIIDTLVDPWILLEAVRDESGTIIDFVWVDANDAACAVNRVTRDELIGARLLEVLPEHRTRGILDRYAQVVETGMPLVEDDEPFTSPFDGKERRFDNRAVKVGDGLSFTWRDVTERYEARRALRQLAEQDPLTGVANRRQLERRLEEILARTPRMGSRIAVLYCDLDHLKEINDTLGHAAGDEALAQVADRVRAAVRDGDLVARLGGDEFVVVLDGIRGASDAQAVAEKVADAVRQPADVGGTAVILRISIGVALARPGEDPTHVLAHADAALYQAKQRGRDRVVVGSEDG